MAMEAALLLNRVRQGESQSQLKTLVVRKLAQATHFLNRELLTSMQRGRRGRMRVWGPAHSSRSEGAMHQRRHCHKFAFGIYSITCFGSGNNRVIVRLEPRHLEDATTAGTESTDLPARAGASAPLILRQGE